MCVMAPSQPSSSPVTEVGDTLREPGSHGATTASSEPGPVKCKQRTAAEGFLETGETLTLASPIPENACPLSRLREKLRHDAVLHVVSAFAEVVVAELAGLVDEERGRPVLIPERPPDRVVVVHHHGIHHA